MIKAKDEVEEVLGQPDIPLSAAQRLTEKRTLAASPGRASPKDAFWLGRHLQNAPLRDVKPQNALFRRVRFSSPGQTRRHLTEKRTLS